MRITDLRGKMNNSNNDAAGYAKDVQKTLKRV